MANTQNLRPFKKGGDNRRNTKGRPIGGRNISTLLREMLEKPVMVNGKEIQGDMVMLMRVLDQTRRGKVGAMKVLMKYMYGKPEKVCPRCDEYESNNQS